jgi:hypothetical protein
VKGLAEFLARKVATPKLSDEERVAYDRACARLHRADTDRRRAEKRGDAQKLAAAERAMERARQARDTIVAPHVSHLWAPERIIGTFEGHWRSPSGSGIHRQECEMVLDHKDLSGPSYRTVRVLKDEGGPPTNARHAPDRMGVAWFAIGDQIQRGQIVVLDEETCSPIRALAAREES